jgi:hypothetical protein
MTPARLPYRFRTCFGNDSEMPLGLCKKRRVVYTDRDDSEDLQLAFKDEPLAPAFRNVPVGTKRARGQIT